MSKIPSALDNLPDPSEAQPPRNPFGRRPETSTGTADDSGDEQKGPSATSGTRANRGAGKAAGEGKKSGSGAERNKRLAGSKDVLLSLPEDLAKRMESAVAYTYPHTGINQQSAFIRWAITKLCAEMEARYNDGNPWPEVPKRKAV